MVYGGYCSKTRFMIEVIDVLRNFRVNNLCIARKKTAIATHCAGNNEIPIHGKVHTFIHGNMLAANRCA